ncbi:hypothetical protein UlMin_014204 [Ulmus minor]
MTSSKLPAFWNHPAGPKTIHFWAPAFKWGTTIANLLESSKPPEQLSYPQQAEELDLFSNSLAMATVATYLLGQAVAEECE